MGLTGRPFVDKHEAAVIDMKRAFLEFMKAARLRALQPEIQIVPDSAPDPGVIKGPLLKLTDHEYPILGKEAAEGELSKSECEQLLRAYIGQHYCKIYIDIFFINLTRALDLTTGKKTKRVPFGALWENPDQLIEDIYIPPGCVIKDPRNMHRQDILSILRHWYKKQEESGPESALRFKQVIGHRRKYIDAVYPTVSQLKSTSEERSKSKEKKKQTAVIRNSLVTDSPDAGQSPTRTINDPADVLSMTPNAMTGCPITPIIPDADQSPFAAMTGLDDILPIGLITNEPDLPALLSAEETLAASAPAQVDSTYRDGLVRINMGQMQQLKNMEFDVFGPSNGPNEGLPEYHVPRSWLQHLPLADSAPMPSKRISPYPPQVQATHGPTYSDPTFVIDPALLNLESTSGTRNPEGFPERHRDDDGPNDHSNLKLAPDSERMTQGIQRRKVVTDDDLAMKEAQQFIATGKRMRKVRARMM